MYAYNKYIFTSNIWNDTITQEFGIQYWLLFLTDYVKCVEISNMPSGIYGYQKTMLMLRLLSFIRVYMWYVLQ